PNFARQVRWTAIQYRPGRISVLTQPPPEADRRDERAAGRFGIRWPSSGRLRKSWRRRYPGEVVGECLDLVECQQPGMLTPDPSTGGDEHRGRHPQDLVVADGSDVEGRAGRVGDLELPQQRPRVVTGTQVDERTDIDADQVKLALGLLVEPLKIGHFCAAGWAQSCPKIQDHRLPLLLPEVRQRDLFPADFRLALVHGDLNIRCEPQRRGRSRIRWRL